MSKNTNTESNNPFAQLDKSQFRDSKDTINPKNQKPRPGVIKKPQNKPTDMSDEEALFLYNMDTVRTLDNIKSQGKKTPKKVEAKAQVEEIFVYKTQEEPIVLSAVIEPKIQKKKHGHELSAQELKEKLADNSAQERRLFQAPPKQNINSQPIPNIPINNEAYDFYSAIKDVTPLQGKDRMLPPPLETFVIQNDPSPLLHDFEEGKLEFSLSVTNDHVQCNIIGLDLLTLGKLQNRHYNPESHIDLHGLKAQEAFQALVPFFKNAYYKDMRCVLIVTGKGNNSFDGKPFLRNKVCDWLIQEPFKRLVLAYCTATNEDGASGALYVLLRKRRKNSPPILWERLPDDYDLWADM